MAISIDASALGANVGVGYVSAREHGNAAAADVQAQGSDGVRDANHASALDALINEPTSLDRLLSTPSLTGSQ